MTPASCLTLSELSFLYLWMRWDLDPGWAKENIGDASSTVFGPSESFLSMDKSQKP